MDDLTTRLASDAPAVTIDDSAEPEVDPVESLFFSVALAGQMAVLESPAIVVPVPLRDELRHAEIDPATLSGRWFVQGPQGWIGIRPNPRCPHCSGAGAFGEPSNLIACICIIRYAGASSREGNTMRLPRQSSESRQEMRARVRRETRALIREHKKKASA